MNGYALRRIGSAIYLLLILIAVVMSVGMLSDIVNGDFPEEVRLYLDSHKISEAKHVEHFRELASLGIFFAAGLGGLGFIAGLGMLLGKAWGDWIVRILTLAFIMFFLLRQPPSADFGYIFFCVILAVGFITSLLPRDPSRDFMEMFSVSGILRALAAWAAIAWAVQIAVDWGFVLMDIVAYIGSGGSRDPGQIVLMWLYAATCTALGLGGLFMLFGSWIGVMAVRAGCILIAGWNAWLGYMRLESEQDIEPGLFYILLAAAVILLMTFIPERNKGTKTL